MLLAGRVTAPTRLWTGHHTACCHETCPEATLINNMRPTEMTIIELPHMMLRSPSCKRRLHLDRGFRRKGTSVWHLAGPMCMQDMTPTMNLIMAARHTLVAERLTSKALCAPSGEASISICSWATHITGTCTPHALDHEGCRAVAPLRGHTNRLLQEQVHDLPVIGTWP